MKKTICALVAVAALSAGCNREDEALSAARNAGWRSILVTDIEGPLNLTCGEWEIAYRIRGENPRGDRVNATVCCGVTYLKGCTIRY